MGQYGLRAKDGRDVVIAIVVLGFLSILSVVLRIISRKMRNLDLAPDDYLIIIALCFVLVSTVLVITSVTQGGVGLHMEKVGAFSDVEYTMKIIIPCQAFYGVGLALIKTSMMVLYYRLFGTKPSLRMAIYITGAIVWAWAFSIVLESFLLCRPVEFNWNPTLPGGKCGNRNAAFVSAGVLNMITDFMVMALPIPYVWKLQLPLGRKMGLVLAFGLGLFVSAISIVRVVSLLRIDFDDATYTLPLPLMWSIVEEQLAIVAANVPLLRGVFAKILPSSWMRSVRHNYKDSGTSASNSKSQSQQQYSLTRMNLGINESEVSSHHVDKHKPISQTIWLDDGESDTELAKHGALPNGIHYHRDFRVE